MQTKQACGNKVQKKLYLFKFQIEALHIFGENAEKGFQRNIFNHIRLLQQKQKTLEVKFQLFRVTEGIVWLEMEKGIDALIEDMMCSIGKSSHGNC